MITGVPLPMSYAEPSLPDKAAITQIEACVISRGSEPTGFVKPPAVPVASEKALVALFNQERTLTSLWKLLTTRPDQIESAKQLGKFDSPLTWRVISSLFPAWRCS